MNHNTVLIVLIIAMSITVTVTSIVWMVCQYKSTFSCKHEWKLNQIVNINQMDSPDRSHNVKFMLCQCTKCGEFRSFSTVPENFTVRYYYPGDLR